MTPSVVSGWVLAPLPACLLFTGSLWALAFSPDIGGNSFLQTTTTLCLLPTVAVAFITLLLWLWLREAKLKSNV